MDRFSIKKVDISAHNVQRFIEQFGDESIQKFINDMLDRVLEKRVILLDEDNHLRVISVATIMKKNPADVVNFLLSRLDFVPPPEEEKIKITLDKPGNNLLVKKKPLRENRVTRWD